MTHVPAESIPGSATSVTPTSSAPTTLRAPTRLVLLTGRTMARGPLDYLRLFAPLLALPWALLLALLVLPTLTACGSAGAPLGTGPPVAFARVGLVEWRIATTAGALVGGPVTLEVTNAGSTAHDL